MLLFLLVRFLGEESGRILVSFGCTLQLVHEESATFMVGRWPGALPFYFVSEGARVLVDCCSCGLY